MDNEITLKDAHIVAIHPYLYCFNYSKGLNMRFYPTRTGILGFITLALLGCITTLSVNMYLSNTMSPSVYGDLFVAMNFLKIVGGMACVGLTSLIPKALPRIASNKFLKHGRFIFFSLKAISFFYATCYLALGIIFFALYFKWVTIFNQSWHVAYYMILIAPTFTLYSILSGLLSVTGRIEIAQVISNIFSPLLMVIFLFMFHHFRVPETTEIVLIIFASNFLTLIVALIFFLAYHSSITSAIIQSRGQHCDEETQWRKECFVFFRYTTFLFIITSCPLYLLEWLGNSETEVAIWGVLSTISLLPKTIQMILYRKFLLNKAAILYTNNKSELQQLLNQTNIAVFTISVVIVFIVLLMNQTILGLFGQEYTHYRTFLAYFMLINILSITNETSWSLLQIVDGGPSFLAKSLQYSLIYVIGCIPFIYLMGLYGLLIIKFFYTIIFALALIIKAKRLTGLNPLVFC